VQESSDKLKNSRELVRLRRIKRYFWIFSTDYLSWKNHQLKILVVMCSVFLEPRRRRPEHRTRTTKLSSKNCPIETDGAAVVIDGKPFKCDGKKLFLRKPSHALDNKLSSIEKLRSSPFQWCNWCLLTLFSSGKSSALSACMEAIFLAAPSQNLPIYSHMMGIESREKHHWKCEILTFLMVQASFSNSS